MEVDKMKRLVGVVFLGLMIVPICIAQEEKKPEGNKGYIYQSTQEKTAEQMLETQLVQGEIPSTQSGPYILDRDDVVKITVLRHPELSGNFSVGPDGKIQYTFVGDIKAKGLTKQELKEKIIDSISPYVKVPEVSVAIVGYNSKKIYVLGAVNRPGLYSLRGNYCSLREAIVMAGLPAKHASTRKIYVITPDKKNPKAKKVNLYDLLYKGKLAQDLTIKPGQVIYVPSTLISKIDNTLGTLLSPVYKAAVAVNVAK
jgi:polysaccharide export outer membrane protein